MNIKTIEGFAVFFLLVMFVMASCGSGGSGIGDANSGGNNDSAVDGSPGTDDPQGTDDTHPEDEVQSGEGSVQNTDNTEETDNSQVTGDNTQSENNTIPKLSAASVSDGDSLTISGTGFGEHPDKPLYYDDYRNANLGDDAVAAGLQKLGSDNRGLPEVVDDMAISGGKSLRMDYSRDQENGQTLEMLPKVGVLVNPASQKLFVSSWTRFTRYQMDLHNKDRLTMKRVRAGYGRYYHGKPGFIDSEKFPGDYYETGWADGWIYQSDRGYSDSTFVSVEDFHHTASHLKSTNAKNGTLHCKEMNKWHRTDYYMDMGDVGVANGVFRHWQDGKPNEQLENIKVRYEGFTGGFEWVISDFCGFSEMNIYNKYYLWMDSFYVSTTQARVELGDNADYDACTVRYIQPSTDWSDTEITVSIRPGTLSGECYLFVLDGNGTVVQSYPLAIE